MSASWRRFWFEPEQTSTLALVRIAFGLIVLAWTATLTHDAFPFFTDSGLLPVSDYEGRAISTWGLLDFFDSRLAVAFALGILSLASLCLAVGQFTRVAAVVVFLGLLSFERRNPFVFNSGDGLLKVIAFYMVLAPSGEALSLDRRRRTGETFWEFPARAPWALRLLQLQLSILYLATVWTKLSGATWNNGTAISFALRLEDLERFAAPSWIAGTELVSNLVTYGTIALEAAIGILVWNRSLRPWVLAFGIALHVGIDLALRVGYFSFGLFVLYLAFLAPDRASARLVEVRERLRALLKRPLAPVAAGNK